MDHWCSTFLLKIISKKIINERNYEIDNKISGIFLGLFLLFTQCDVTFWKQRPMAGYIAAILEKW